MDEPTSPARDSEIYPRILEMIESDRMDHAFQPIWDLNTQRLVGFEGLARFPNGLEPQRAWEIAMQQGQGRELDVLSMRNALYEARNLPGLLFLNMHPDHLVPSGGPSAGVGVSLARYRHREALVVEVVETQEGDRARAVAGIERLRGLGVRSALDDAGTGMATAERLAWLKPSFVKLDRSMIMEAYLDGNMATMVEWIAESHRMGALVIAEDIEDRAMGPWLHQWNVDWVQGYAYGRPKPAAYWHDNLWPDGDADQLSQALEYYCPSEWEIFRRGQRFKPLDGREMGELLFSDLPAPICVIDQEGRLAGMNRQAERFWRVDGGVVVGQAVETALGIRNLSPEPTQVNGETTFRRYRVERVDGSEEVFTLSVLSAEKRGRPYSIMVVSNTIPMIGLPLGFGMDPLTGLASTIWWQEARMSVTGAGAVVFLDLDGLKAVNDLFGHAEGDKLLSATGRRIQQASVAGMIAIRYGVDEFLVVWPNATADAATAWVEALARETAQDRTARVPIRFGYGVATFHDGALAPAIAEADQRLMEMKRFRLPTQSGGGLILSGIGRRTLWQRAEALPEVSLLDPTYDDIGHGLDRTADERARHFIDWVNLERGSAVVEVGAGSGRLAVAGGLVDRVGPEGQYLMTDISAVQLAQAFRKIRPDQSWVHCQVAAASDLPVVSRCVDVAIGSYFIYECSVASVLAELARIVGPGGHLALAEIEDWLWPGAWREFWQPWVEIDPAPMVSPLPDLAQRAGFQLEREAAIDDGVLEFPSVEWALSFVVQSPIWRRVRPVDLTGEMAIAALRARLRLFAPERLAIPVTRKYRWWVRRAPDYPAS